MIRKLIPALAASLLLFTVPLDTYISNQKEILNELNQILKLDRMEHINLLESMGSKLSNSITPDTPHEIYEELSSAPNDTQQGTLTDLLASSLSKTSLRHWLEFNISLLPLTRVNNEINIFIFQNKISPVKTLKKMSYVLKIEESKKLFNDGINSELKKAYNILKKRNVSKESTWAINKTITHLELHKKAANETFKSAEYELNTNANNFETLKNFSRQITKKVNYLTIFRNLLFYTGSLISIFGVYFIKKPTKIAERLQSN